VKKQAETLLRKPLVDRSSPQKLPENADRYHETQLSPTEHSFGAKRKMTQFPKTAFSLSWGRRFLWSTIFLGAAATSAIAGAGFALLSPLPEDLAGPAVIAKETATRSEKKAWQALLQYQVERPVNILVMGIDRVLDAEEGSDEVFNGHSDTMLLVRFDPTDNTLRMLSIPRDTRTFIPDVGLAKINDANVYGGADLAAQVVGETLNDIPIDRYIRVTNNAFRELVDLVGGVEVYVPHAMSYKDATQQLEINLEEGLQTLNGDRAEQFARFRMDEYGDIGRVQRQQILLKALRQRLQSPAVLPLLPNAVRIMQQYVDTDLSMEEMLALVGFGLNLEKDQIGMVLLPGRFSEKHEFEGISYWLMSRNGRDRVLAEYFGQESEITQRDRSLNRVRIAIQNATDDPDLSTQVADYLRERNFRNVYLSQHASPRQLSQTEIVVQQGDTEAAQNLQEALGFGRVEADSTGDLGSQLTLRVGSDWRTEAVLLESRSE